MLTLTENAATAIRTLVESAQAPADAGLRISDDPTGPALELAITGGPEAADQVVEGPGARVFLDDQAATVLADKTLDAASDGAGNLQFGITEQA